MKVYPAFAVKRVVSYCPKCAMPPSDWVALRYDDPIVKAVRKNGTAMEQADHYFRCKCGTVIFVPKDHGKKDRKESEAFFRTWHKVRKALGL